MITHEARIELLEDIIADPTEKSETRLKALELYNELSTESSNSLPGDLTEEQVGAWAIAMAAKLLGVTPETLEALRKPEPSHE